MSLSSAFINTFLPNWYNGLWEKSISRISELRSVGNSFKLMFVQSAFLFPSDHTHLHLLHFPVQSSLLAVAALQIAIRNMIRYAIFIWNKRAAFINRPN
jgi:hypothetical protein